MIQLVEISFEDVISTNTYKQADDLTKKIWTQKHCIKSLAGWVTVARDKGLNKVLNLYHMTDFKRNIVIELYNKK